MQSIDEMRYGAYGMISQRLERKREQLVMMQEAFKRHGVEQRLVHQKEQLQELRERLNGQIRVILEGKFRELSPLRERLSQTIESFIRQKQNILSQMTQAYESQHPKHKNKRGFAQITRDGKVIDLDDLSVGDEYTAMNDKTVVTSKVVKKVTI